MNAETLAHAAKTVKDFAFLNIEEMAEALRNGEFRRLVWTAIEAMIKIEAQRPSTLAKRLRDEHNAPQIAIFTEFMGLAEKEQDEVGRAAAIFLDRFADEARRDKAARLNPEL